MMVDLVARGDQRHAGLRRGRRRVRQRRARPGRATCSSSTACSTSRTHPVLGRTTATPTMLEAGVSRNVTPPRRQGRPRRPQHAGLDPRGDRRRCCERALDSEVVVTSQRLVPCETPAGSAPARRRPPRPARSGAVRQPDLLRLGVPAPRWTRSRRARHQPPLAHAGRVRGPARGDRGARLLRRRWRATTSTGATGDRTHACGGRARDSTAACSTTPPADDRPWDARLLRWDVLGSLGHVEGLRASGLLSRARARAAAAGAARRRWRRWTRGRLRVAPGRRRTCTPRSRTGSPAGCPAWASGCTPAARATTRSRATSGSTSRTGCSRSTPRRSTLAEALLAFAAPAPRVLWPGYTHQRRAMPSSVGLWAGAYAEGLLDTVESLAAVWARVDRSPLGSAAGYGVPLPLRREAVGEGARLRAGSTGTWPRCRAGGASSRRPRCSGARSWGTTSAGSPRT